MDPRSPSIDGTYYPYDHVQEVFDLSQKPGLQASLEQESREESGKPPRPSAVELEC